MSEKEIPQQQPDAVLPDAKAVGDELRAFLKASDDRRTTYRLIREGMGAVGHRDAMDAFADRVKGMGVLPGYRDETHAPQDIEPSSDSAGVTPSPDPE